MPDRDLTALSREELEREVLRLRTVVRSGDMDVTRQNAVFNSALDFAIVVTDTNGKISDWNIGAERTMGWTAQEMRGQNASRFFTPEDQAAGRADLEMNTALRDGRARDERWHLRKDGQRFWASGEMMALRDDAGTHMGFVKILRDRTPEHLAGKALEDAEQQLRRAQEAGGIGLFSVNMADNQLRPTPEFCRLYGVPVQDSFPATLVESLVVPEDAHLVSTAADRAREDYVSDVEYRIRRGDTGELRWINRKGEIEHDENGRPVSFSGVARDVTAQRGIRNALAASEERFRAILDTIEVAFAIVEVKFDADDRPVDYRFVEANPAFVRQAGVDLRGKWVTEFAPNLEQFWFETYGRVAKTGEQANFESYADAFRRWFDVRAVRVDSPDDRRIAILFSDVTARRVAEDRLRVSEAVARESIERVELALAAGAIIGTWVWNIPTDRFTVDEAFARSFGLDPMLGREGISLAEIVQTVHPDDQADLAKAISDALERGGRYAHQYRVRREDGQYHWLEANGHVELGSDGKPLNFPGVLIDVAERRAMAAERDRALQDLRMLNETLEQRVAERTESLRRSQEALQQSQKMEAVGQLTGGLAHDFNNLLAVVTGSLELAERRIEQARFVEVPRFLEAAQTSARRAAALTHRLLAFSRRQTLDPQLVDVNRLVGDMADLVRRTVGPEIRVEIPPTADVWHALVDGNQLENALLNLCINARDAMPGGGRIMIETANKTLGEREATQRDLQAGDYVVLSVTDTGTGMSPDVVGRVFEPFFTTKPIGQGTGLGLSMVYGFARQSGGQVRIHSEVDRGTTVHIYLPRSSAEHASPAASEQTSFGLISAAAGQTVLVVDDEQAVRTLIVDVLSDLGYTAIEAHDGSAGLVVLQSDMHVDLLITDVGMPGMNGRQLADAGRALRSNLKVLFITGYAETAVVTHNHLEQGMAIVTKPFSVDSLAARIKSLIESV